MSTSRHVSADTGKQRRHMESRSVLINPRKPTSLVSLKFHLVSGFEAETIFVQSATLHVPSGMNLTPCWLELCSLTSCHLELCHASP